MEVVLVFWLLTYAIRNVAQDFAWKARGEDPPSYRREQARIARREARRPLTDRRAARRFWANAWADAWEAAEARRERAHKRAMERRGEDPREDEDDDPYPGPSPAPIPPVTDAAPEPVAPAPEPVTPDSTGDTAPSSTPPPIVPPTPSPAPPEPTPSDDCPVPEESGGSVDPDGSWAELDADRRARDDSLNSSAEYDALSDEEKERLTAEASAKLAGGDATVTPITKNQPPAPTPAATPGNQEELSVTTPNAETTGLTSAIAYAEGMASNASGGVQSIETSVASLQGGGVGGAAIGHFEQAKEHLAAAAAAFGAAQTELEADLTVKESYDARPDAGSKEFVTAD